MNEEELMAGCKQAITDKEFDEATIEVLCWGIMKATEKRRIILEICYCYLDAINNFFYVRVKVRYIIRLFIRGYYRMSRAIQAQAIASSRA